MIEPKLATTITEAFNAVNPTLPLLPGDHRHVDFTAWRGDDSVAETIQRRIIRANSVETPSHVKQLVAGHPGSGKTTELRRLEANLEALDKPFAVVYFDASEALDINNVDYADVLMAMIAQIAVKGHQKDLFIPEPNLPQLRACIEPIVREVSTSVSGGAGVEVGPFGGLFSKLMTALKFDHERRDDIRAEVRRSPSIFLEDLNDAIDNLQMQARSRGKAGLVVIADSLDRIVPHMLEGGQTTHSQIFVTHADQLKAPRCHLVLTMPVSLAYDVNLGTRYPVSPLVQPMLRVRERSGEECEGALAAMEKAVRRRVNVDMLFQNPSDLRDLCLFSGGHLRELMRLLRNACDYADDRFTSESVAKAKRSLTRDYDRITKDAELDSLVHVHQARELPSDAQYAFLTYALKALEYQNGGRWADVHPAVQATEKFKRHLKASSIVQDDA